MERYRGGLKGGMSGGTSIEGWMKNERDRQTVGECLRGGEKEGGR